MNQTKKYIEISALLCKQRSGVISKKEEAILEEWKNASIENQDLYDRLDSDAFMEEKEKIYAEIDSRGAWKKVQSEISAKKWNKRQLYYKVLKCAAVIGLIFMLGTVFVYMNIDIQENYSELLVDQIKPGINKAVLVLSDGSRVDLEEKKDTLIESHVLNRNSKLTYNKNSQHSDSSELHWHKLFVPVGGEYQLQLSDGSRVWLNSDSKLRYPDQFVGKNRVVYLSGEAYFEVSKDTERRFIVKTNSLDVKVYGTEFNLMAYDDDEQVQATLSEGSVLVNVTNSFGKELQYQLAPNMQCSYSKSKNECRVLDVDARKYSGWKDGKLQFDNESLDGIARKLERWYNVKFFFQNEKVKTIRYTGELKKFADFKLILNFLEIGTDVKFVVKNKVIIVQG